MIARKSVGFRDEEYECKQAWPEGVVLQCGGERLVLAGPSYRTAFFEAFPGTFIRGEGGTIEDAEEACYKRYARQLACPGHEYEPRGYTNGGGLCRYCDRFQSNAFPPTTTCVVCGTAAFGYEDIVGNIYCEQHRDSIPEEMRTELHKAGDSIKAEYARWNASPGAAEEAIGSFLSALMPQETKETRDVEQ